MEPPPPIHPASSCQAPTPALPQRCQFPTIVISHRVRMSAESKGRCGLCARRPNANDGGTHMSRFFLRRCSGGHCAGASRANSSGHTSTFARSQAAHLALAVASWSLLAMVPRTTWGRAAGQFWRSSRFASFFVVLDGPVVSLWTLRGG